MTALETKLVADAMLGKLARWLRILGFDTLYDPHAEDRNLVRIARGENRVLLTRDTRLAAVRREGLEIVLVRSDHFREQLREVLATVGRPGGGLFSRCLICNERLRETSAAEAAGAVPEHVLAAAGSFRRCPSCRRIYWRGTHLDGMRKVLSEEGILGADLNFPGPSA